VKRCLQGISQADVKGLSVYGLPGPSVPYGLTSSGPQVARARGGLAPIVVFAAEWAPGFLPDIAVGLALAEHMARAYGEVSLVVVPRYLEADSQLNATLREQRGLVKGGVILGDRKILSDDTRALFRQLLTSIDRRGFLGEMRTTLGSVEPLVVALLALFALGTAYATAPRKDDVSELKKIADKLRSHVRALRSRVVIGVQEPWESIVSRIRRTRSYPEPTLVTWREKLGSDAERPVTIQLISGSKVTGKLPDEGEDRPIETVIRLEVANTQEGHQVKEYVLVRVADIESIRVPPPPLPVTPHSADGKTASEEQPAPRTPLTSALTFWRRHLSGVPVLAPPSQAPLHEHDVPAA
jgi:hypothetical protein